MTASSRGPTVEPALVLPRPPKSSTARRVSLVLVGVLFAASTRDAGADTRSAGAGRTPGAVAARTGTATLVVSEGLREPFGGTGAAGAAGLGGAAERCELNRPHGVLRNPFDGALYVADSENHRVIRVD